MGSLRRSCSSAVHNDNGAASFSVFVICVKCAALCLSGGSGGGSLGGSIVSRSTEAVPPGWRAAGLYERKNSRFVCQCGGPFVQRLKRSRSVRFQANSRQCELPVSTWHILDPERPDPPLASRRRARVVQAAAGRLHDRPHNWNGGDNIVIEVAPSGSDESRSEEVHVQ